MNTTDPHPEVINNPAARKAWIRQQLDEVDMTLAEIADVAGVSKAVVYNVFRRPSPRVERAIAKALDLAPQTLFPERYDDFGIHQSYYRSQPSDTTQV